MKKKFENRLRFEKVIAKSLVASFFGTQCRYIYTLNEFTVDKQQPDTAPPQTKIMGSPPYRSRSKYSRSTRWATHRRPTETSGNDLSYPTNTNRAAYIIPFIHRETTNESTSCCCWIVHVHANVTSAVPDFQRQTPLTVEQTEQLSFRSRRTA